MKTFVALVVAMFMTTSAMATDSDKKKKNSDKNQTAKTQEQKDAKPSGFFVVEGNKVVDISNLDWIINRALYSENDD